MMLQEQGILECFLVRSDLRLDMCSARKAVSYAILLDISHLCAHASHKSPKIFAC